MKALIRYVFLGLFLFSFCASAQKAEGLIMFKDGATNRGFVKINGEKVKFKTHKKEKHIWLNFSALEKVTIYGWDRVSTYVSLDVIGEEKPLIVEQVIGGKVSLYQQVSHGYNPGYIGGAGSGFGFSAGYSYSINDYYLKREGENKAFHLGSTNLFSKNFKKAASDYFKDCPSLVKKIQNKEYKKKDIRLVIEFYNRECP